MIATCMFWKRDVSIDSLDSGFDADADSIDVSGLTNSKERDMP